MIPLAIMKLEDPSAVGEIRRRGAEFASRLGFPETAAGRIGLILTEIGTNLIRHAREGAILLQALNRGGQAGLEVLAFDKGPGMADPVRCMQDGFSTAGSQGTGLGAVRRASEEFDLVSETGRGTVLMSRIWAGPCPPHLPCRPMTVGAISLPYQARDPCGDVWAVEQTAHRCLFLVGDGLGHGEGAAIAAREAEKIFRQHASQPPAAVVEAIHVGLRSTRGAAVAVLEVDLRVQIVRCCGIGNISIRLIKAQGEKTLVSHNGTAGQATPRIQEFSHPWDHDDLLALHSDGLTTRWSLADRPALRYRHPTVIAGALFRDFHRDTDDATILIARRRQPTPREESGSS